MDHISVLFDETIQSLALDGFSGRRIVVDATLGRGGHAQAVIAKLGKNDVFIGFDAYEKNFLFTKQKLQDFADTMPESPVLHFVHANFSELKQQIEDLGYTSVTHVYADLGLSSIHLDDSESTFSFQNDTRLDMRFHPSTPLTAEEIIQKYPFRDLANMFRKYGDENMAGKIAKAIVHDRDLDPFTSNKQLADMILRVTHSKKSVTRCFQALRIEVNDEYGALENMLSGARDLLVSGGTISVISFHSGEDRIIKHLFREWCKDTIDDITGQVSIPGAYIAKARKPILPSEQEILSNPRARSAKLRTVQKR